MKTIGAEFLLPDDLPGVNHMRGMQYQIVLNIAFCPELKFVCTTPTQNIKINLHSKPPFSTHRNRLLIRQSLDRIWSMPLPSLTSINKLQVMQNAALRTATGCTQDTNVQHIHDETLKTSHTRAPAAPRLTIQTEITTSITPPKTHTIYFTTPRLKHYLF